MVVFTRYQINQKNRKYIFNRIIVNHGRHLYGSKNQKQKNIKSPLVQTPPYTNYKGVFELIFK